MAGWRFVDGGGTPPPGGVVRPDERLSWPRTVGLGTSASFVGGVAAARAQGGDDQQVTGVGIGNTTLAATDSFQLGVGNTERRTDAPFGRTRHRDCPELHARMRL